MSFLQPALLLAALPIAALPIIIHLINQRRYQTVRWGAMMFLLAANRMSRGYARVRQWLILAMRTLAILALAIVLGRPLTGGWLGLTAGGRADTTIVILDRSPSMQEAGAGSGLSKLDAAKRQVVETLRTVGKSRWVLIDAATGRPRELESLDALLSAPDAGPTGATSDIPALLGAARDYLDANKSGQADIWIASDLRSNDWDPESGRWAALRDAFLELGQRARFHLLAYAGRDRPNQAVRITSIRRQEAGDGVELLISARLAREGAAEGATSVPVRFEIDGARSEVAVDLAAGAAALKDYRVVLDKGRGRGFGRVAIPADANPADNDFYFAFDRPKARRAVIVAEDPEAARPLELAAAISPDPAVKCAAEVIAPDGLTGVEWEKVGLLLWQAPLPDGEAAALVKAYVDRGGRVIFFPPRVPTADQAFGVRWDRWVAGEKAISIDGWRSDQDLLAQTQSGAPLPVGVLEVRKHCKLGGEVTALATLKGGDPLLARAATTRGGAYFCATGATPDSSSLASGGVVFYVLVQRALADGAAVLEDVRQVAAGQPPAGLDPKDWKRLAGAEGVLSTDYAAQPGVYEAGAQLLALNRPASEDLAPTVPPDRVAGLFRGLDFTRVDDTADGASSLVQEIWRLFLVAMMAALVIEAGLCLPKIVRPAVPGGIRA